MTSSSSSMGPWVRLTPKNTAQIPGGAGGRHVLAVQTAVRVGEASTGGGGEGRGDDPSVGGIGLGLVHPGVAVCPAFTASSHPSITPPHPFTVSSHLTHSQPSTLATPLFPPPNPPFWSSPGLSGLSNQFASSMSAGLIYSIITMPFETAKNRMAFQVRAKNIPF